MVRIKSIEEIDREKLRKLFEKRGHGLLSPRFTKKIEAALESKDLEVHQCKCGEIMILHRSMADKLRKQYNSNEVPCKRCGNYENEVLDLTILERIEKITAIFERWLLNEPSQKFLDEEDTKKIKELAKGLFPTGHPDEFIIGFHFFTLALKSHFTTIEDKEDDIYSKLINKLILEAKKANLAEFNNLKNIIDWYTMSIESFNTSAHEIAPRKQKILFENTKLMGIQAEDTFDLEKYEILTKLSAYKDALESQTILTLLLNLVYIIEGIKICKNPFRKIKLPSSRLKQGKKVKGLKDMIETFNLFKSGKKIYALLTRLYDTQLRNAFAHNQYKIVIDSKEIELTRYGRKISFEEFIRLYEELLDFQSAVQDAFYYEFYVINNPEEIRNWGIEAVILGYTDPQLIGDELYPTEELTPELDVLQYWSFACTKSGEHIPVPQIEIKNGYLNIKFGEKNSFSYSLELESVRRWIDFLIIRGGYTLSLLTIAPKLPIFAEHAILTIPLGKDGENVFVLDVSEKFVNLPLKFLKEISNIIEEFEHRI